MGLMGLKMRHSKWVLRSNGLEAKLVELDNGSTVHCWLPADTASAGKCIGRGPKDDEADDDEHLLKPALLLLHGFGGEATIAWENQVPRLAKRFRLFIPDLLFFGDSTTTNKQRSELFQAETVMAMMDKLGVRRAAIAGHSYGGFVAYRMAHLFPEFVSRVVFISSGIMMNPTTNNSLLEDFGAAAIEDVLVPKSVADTKKAFKLLIHNLPSWLPTFFFKEMCLYLNKNREERLELVKELVVGKHGAPPLPKIHQDALIIWGERDQIFNVELAKQLNEYIGQQVDLVIIKGVGHAPPLESPKKVNQLLLQFLFLK